MRKLLEVTHEAFMDSGVDYKALRGSSRVGVYLGCCGSEVHAMWLSDYNSITGYEQTGCTLSMFANRLSFFFNFKGPSKAVDTGALLHARCHRQSCFNTLLCIVNCAAAHPLLPSARSPAASCYATHARRNLTGSNTRLMISIICAGLPAGAFTLSCKYLYLCRL